MGSFKLKTSSIKRLSNSLLTWYWVCPICGYRGIYESYGRGLQAAKLHLMRKHKLEVEVVEDE